jgi:hypothetical protein
MLEVEGYRYDVTADLLTVHVVRDGREGSEAERAELDIPISTGLRTLVQSTMAHLRDSLATGPSVEP